MMDLVFGMMRTVIPTNPLAMDRQDIYARRKDQVR